MIASFPWGTKCLILSSGRSYNTKGTVVRANHTGNPSSWAHRHHNATAPPQQVSGNISKPSFATCPLFPSHAHANGGLCGPGSSCDEGAPEWANIHGANLRPQQYKVHNCNRRFLLFKSHAFEEALPPFKGIWHGNIQCRVNGKPQASHLIHALLLTQLLQNITLEINAAHYPDVPPQVHVTGTKVRHDNRVTST